MDPEGKRFDLYHGRFQREPAPKPAVVPVQTVTGRHICQVAFSALNGAALRDWYANVFGLVKSGKVIFFPPSTTKVQGVPGAWEKCSWLIDQQDYFQLEFFQFWTPSSKLRPDDWRPSDIGYNMIGIAVSDFDQVLRNVGAFSAVGPPQIFGETGARRACVADPEGNLVEIFEQDPMALVEGGNADIIRPEVPAVVRSMRASVPNLEDARQAYVEALGLQPVQGHSLHSSADEAMWGLTGAQADSVLLRSDNFLLELVEYQSPAPRARPAGYSIADQGFMNIAIGFRDSQHFDNALKHATSHGLKANGDVVDIGVFRVMYVNDRHGFSVEMLNARKKFWSISGFNPREAYVENEISINAPSDQVWRQLTDHAGMASWSLFNCRVLRPGAPAPGGVGCLRELSAPGLRIVEEITDWEAGRHYAYRVLTGAPFRKHRGDVYVVQERGLTRVRWAIRFDSWIPFSGKIIAWVLQLVFRRALQTLKTQLED